MSRLQSFILAAISLLALFTVFRQPAAAQSYPVKPVRVIVAQAPGGASDLLIRLLAQRLSETLGQQFIVDNRPGAGGNIGAEIAAKAAPDGYSLFMVSAPHTAAPSLYSKLSYSLLRDFAPISMLGSEPLCASINPSLPAKSIRELVVYLKSKPGQVSYGSTGNGAVNHLATELFKWKAGVDMVHVPYKGSAAAIPDVIDGRIGVLFANVSPLLPHVRAGKLRALGVTSASRVSAMPDVPTIAESGYPGYEAVNWFGVVAPARTSASIVHKLNGTIVDALNIAEVRESFEKRGAQAMPGSEPDMRAFMTAEVKKWAEVIRVSGARVD
jgi:tripartite-type tricarboxylate transporter receptor subunit TctC